MVYNDLNQLTQKHNGTAGDFGSGTERYSYTYDDNGNLLEKKRETKVSVWSQAEKWTYEWNPRDQRTRAVKYTTGADNVGSVEYEYCLSCDGALSKRLEFGAGSGSSAGALASGYRFEYDGLKLLRVDERSTGGAAIENSPWRVLEMESFENGGSGCCGGRDGIPLGDSFDLMGSGHIDDEVEVALGSGHRAPYRRRIGNHRMVGTASGNQRFSKVREGNMIRSGLIFLTLRAMVQKFLFYKDKEDFLLQSTFVCAIASLACVDWAVPAHSSIEKSR